EQRDKDIETTRKACEKFKTQPITIMNYVEGTRFTREKHIARKSPYKNLLPPKAGGIAFVLATLEDYIQFIVDTTIIYHTDEISFWNFLCGRIPNITVKYTVIPVPAHLRGDYYHDKEFRKQFQQWLNERWLMKDNIITQERVAKIKPSR
nr:acetyltransferase [Pseudomonadota bacterium]